MAPAALNKSMEDLKLVNSKNLRKELSAEEPDDSEEEEVEMLESDENEESSEEEELLSEKDDPEDLKLARAEFQRHTLINEAARNVNAFVQKIWL